MPLRILHFADAHIDMANYGRHDEVTGLPLRVVDFLNSLDTIVNTAIEERVDLVIFAGDAYKDRNPQPTFQRAWGERIMRLSDAGIPTLLLVGNHDMAPADYRAHTLQEFRTLQVPRVFVADEMRLWGPAELGVPVQVISIPWLTRSKLMARYDMSGIVREEIHQLIEDRLNQLIVDRIEKADPSLPLILTAHATIQGAVLGHERQIMLGQDIVLGRGLVSDPRLDYVALGHIHKHQALMSKPPVVYAGSIERVDFGEAGERKGFVMVTVEKGNTRWEFRPILTRPFFDWEIRAGEPMNLMDDIMRQLPPAESLEGAICRLRLYYTPDHEPYLDEKRLAEHVERAFDFRLVRNREGTVRVTLPPGMTLESLPPSDLLELYLKSKSYEDDEVAAMKQVATEIIASARADMEPID